MAKNDSVSTTPALEIKKRTPAEWAAQCFPAGTRGMPHPKLWQHKAAAALHGWGDHEHHAGEPIKLTGEEYYGALVAASEPATDGNYLAHLPACSPHGTVAKQLAAYVPAAPQVAKS